MGTSLTGKSLLKGTTLFDYAKLYVTIYATLQVYPKISLSQQVKEIAAPFTAILHYLF